MSNKYLSITEIARRCKKSRTTIHNWIKDGLKHKIVKPLRMKPQIQIRMSDVAEFEHWRKPRYLVHCPECGYEEYRDKMFFQCWNCDNVDVEFRSTRGIG